MNKQEERNALDAVFGKLVQTVDEGEEPDFACSADGGVRFGVEVTAFYWTESDARLRNIRNYASDLIAGGSYRHKDDIHEIKVEDVVYHAASTGQSFPLKAIGRMVPPHRASVPKLLAAIAGKNEKASRYHLRVRPVDLIVVDVEMVLRFETVQQLLEPILAAADAARVIESPLREIYVITRNTQKGVVYVPLRANLFAAEIALFSDVFRTLIRETGSRATVQEYLEALNSSTHKGK